MIFKFSNFQIFKLGYDQDRYVFQRELPGVDGKSNLAFMDTVTTKHCYCFGGHRYHYSYGMGDGFFQQPIVEADLFII